MTDDRAWETLWPDTGERAPRPVGTYTMWSDEWGRVRMAGPVPAGMLTLALAAVTLAGIAGAVAYARRRDWLRLGACAVLASGCGYLAARLF